MVYRTYVVDYLCKYDVMYLLVFRTFVMYLRISCFVLAFFGVFVFTFDISVLYFLRFHGFVLA